MIHPLIKILVKAALSRDIEMEPSATLIPLHRRMFLYSCILVALRLSHIFISLCSSFKIVSTTPTEFPFQAPSPFPKSTKLATFIIVMTSQITTASAATTQWFLILTPPCCGLSTTPSTLPSIVSSSPPS